VVTGLALPALGTPAFTQARPATSWWPLAGSLFIRGAGLAPVTIAVKALIERVEVHWYNQTPIQVGGVLVRLGVLEGEFHWHTHEEQDEFFFVLDPAVPDRARGRRHR
jgi:hypothetical protein